MVSVYRVDSNMNKILQIVLSIIRCEWRLKRYRVDNDNINDTELEWILKKYRVDNVTKLDWILKWYQVDNNNIDNTVLDGNATVF